VRVFRAETADDNVYNEIVSLLRDGGIVAFPTDTAYGLGVDPFNEAAVDRIFQVKGRSETKPILLLVNSIDLAVSVTQPSKVFYDVAEEFWPGPLTIICRAAGSLFSKLTAGTATIGVRWPIAPFSTNLVSRFGKPITATSANRSGMPSAISADEVFSQLGNSIDAIIDGGVLPSRGGSTLLDLTTDPPNVLREGPVTFDRLSEFFKGRLRRQIA
jgi:L-threonylcarbamoyladenylate synthase